MTDLHSSAASNGVTTHRGGLTPTEWEILRIAQKTDGVIPIDFFDEQDHDAVGSLLSGGLLFAVKQPETGLSVGVTWRGKRILSKNDEDPES